ncbi:MAG: hypothetical protein LBQ74_20115 [Prevotella sp.]|jgi:DNA-binding protein|nr:hypothetical protein [Prevotella sp.]
MKKKSKDKKYIVSIYMKYAHEVKVKASNKWVAKAIAFARFIKNLTQNDFTIYVDLDET